jgi:hypothetical protein
MDVPYDSIPDGNAGLRGDRNYAVARGRRERWRGLRARFRDVIASDREQDFYFGDDFLLRRHDYQLEIAGGIPVAQYVYDVVEADGFHFPAKRRACVRGLHLSAIRDLLLISLDLGDFHVMS